MVRVFAFSTILTVVVATAAVSADLTTVIQRSRAFSTTALEVGAGDVIRFKNEDTFLHQLYIEAPRFSFESAEQEPGEDVDVRFTSAGLFEVRCHIHPKMLLRVNVH